MHAKSAFAPQFDGFEPEVVSAPVRRARRRRAVTGGFDCDPLQQRCARIERLALQAGPRADAAVDRSRREIRIAFLGRAEHHAAFKTDLPAHRVPVQHAGDARIRREFVALAAVVVGEEDDITRVRDDLLAQYDARRWRAVRRGRREHHRVRVGLHFLFACLAIPALEDGHRILGQGRGQRSGMRHRRRRPAGVETRLCPSACAISCGASRRTGKRNRPSAP